MQAKKSDSPDLDYLTLTDIFFFDFKNWAQKNPEVVETSGLFALISFLVQLDGKLHPLRYTPIPVDRLMIIGSTAILLRAARYKYQYWCPTLNPEASC